MTVPHSVPAPPTAQPGWALALFSGFVLSLWLLGCAFLVVSELNSPSAFLTGLGYALAASLALIGNAVSLVLHAIYWARYGAPGWLKGLVGLQGVVALGALLWLGGTALNKHREAQAFQRYSTVRSAIEQDDVPALARAWADCGGTCGQGWLVDAAQARAAKAVAFLIAHGETVSSQFGARTRDLRTCEDRYLPSLSALDIAVAQDDAGMVGQLFPVSDANTQRRALWQAAELDRLERLQQLLALGVPVDIRGHILDENNTLLVAAAEGAALRVGRWLIAQHHMPANAVPGPGPDPYRGTPPLHALAHFMFDVKDSPRTLPFLQLLVARGAHIDEPRPDGTTLLQEAIRLRDRPAATALLATGASKTVLSAPEFEQLHAVLALPDRPGPEEPTGDCVPVSSHEP